MARAGAPDPQSEVSLRTGRLRGIQRGGVTAFLGIPYAAPPVGALRFRPPSPPVPWSGTRDAAAFGPNAPQLAGAGLVGRIARSVGPGFSEDCLYLNVWTSAAAKASRPVLVWLHGGGFFLGAGSRFLYSGEELARQGVVVVTLNYRLGAFGFLDLTSLSKDGQAPSNHGLRDQLAALEWVRNNISVFGGDPDRITLFGESAGAMSAATLLTLESGLFQRAILQSGAAANVSTADEAAEVGELFLHYLGARADDLKFIRRMPLERLLAAQRKLLRVATSQLDRLPWQPSIDNRLLFRTPIESIRRGASKGVDLLIGTNRDEWRLFTAGAPNLRWMRQAGLRRHTSDLLARLGVGREMTSAVIEAYGRNPDRRRRPYDTWTELRTDEVFRQPAIALAESHAAHHPRTFMYRFDFEIPLLPRTLRACHAAEMPLVFGSFEHPILRPVYLRSSKTKAMSETLQRAWIGFASTGEPAAPTLPRWLPYEAKHRRTMILASQPRLEKAPEDAKRRLWQDLTSR